MSLATSAERGEVVEKPYVHRVVSATRDKTFSGCLTRLIELENAAWRMAENMVLRRSAVVASGRQRTHGSQL